MKNFILIGNLGTGKTTLGKAIAEKLDIPIFSIDEYRIKYNPKGNFQQEFRSWFNLRNDIQKHDQVIFDSTGTSQWYDVILDKLKGENVIIKLFCTPDLMKKRISERDQKVPLPYKFELDYSISAIFQKLDKIEAHFNFDSGKLTINEMLNQLNI